jgi:cytochrome P450
VRSRRTTPLVETPGDPFTLYARLRAEDPVHRSADGTVVLTRFADVWRAAGDTATFSSAQGLTFTNEVEMLGIEPTIVMMDPPDHTRYRRLVSRGFTPRHVRDLEPALRAFVDERIDVMVAERSGDFIAAIARPVPSWVVAHYLGVPVQDRHKFDEWTSAIVQGDGTMRGAERALADLYAYFGELIERRRREPGDDLVSILLQADEEGAGIGIEGILGYGFVMIAGGNDTATGLLGGAAELLTTHPDQRDQLVENPEGIPTAVEEILRFTSPVQGLCRVTTAATSIRGERIAAGERVLLCYAAANRDEEEFGPDAETLNLNRRFNRLLTFSSGNHFCLGAAAARLEGRIVLERLLARCPDLGVDPQSGTFADGAFTRRYAALPYKIG